MVGQFAWQFGGKLHQKHTYVVASSIDIDSPECGEAANTTVRLGLTMGGRRDDRHGLQLLTEGGVKFRAPVRRGAPTTRYWRGSS